MSFDKDSKVELKVFGLSEILILKRWMFCFYNLINNEILNTCLPMAKVILSQIKVTKVLKGLFLCHHY